MNDIAYKEIKIAAGSVLLKENTTSDFIYVVKSGVLIGVKESDGRLIKTSNFGEGDFLGVVDIFENEVYKESVISQTASIVLALPARDIKNVVKKSPAWLGSLVKVITSRLNHGLNIISEHKINNESDDTFSIEQESNLRKVLKGK